MSEGGFDTRQGATDWAYSIQARFAEKLAADLVQIANHGPKSPHPRTDIHKTNVVAAMAALGVAPTDIETHRKAQGDPLHELDEVWVRTSLNGHMSKITNSLEPNLRARTANVVLSSLPSGSVSAFCAVNSWDDYKYIFVDADVLTLCKMAAKIMAVCLYPMIDQQGDFTNLDTRRPIDVAKSAEVADRAYDLFSAVVVKRAARGSKPWVPEPQVLPLAVSLAALMEMFVVAHELSHVLAGHFDRAERFEAEVLGPDSAAGLAFAHDDEFEADGLAILLTIDAMAEFGKRSVVPQIAPYVFLKCVELLTACESIFGAAPDPELSSHPPPSQRVMRARSLTLEQSAVPAQLAAVLTRVDQVFFQISRPTLTRLKALARDGVIPRPRVMSRLLGMDRPAILGVTDLGATDALVAYRGLLHPA